MRPLHVLLLLATSLQAQDADVVLYGRVWTGDSARPWAEAVAARGDRILAVGGGSDVAMHVTPRTRVMK